MYMLFSCDIWKMTFWPLYSPQKLSYRFYNYTDEETLQKRSITTFLPYQMMMKKNNSVTPQV